MAKAPNRNPFGTEETPNKFADFDVFTKLRVLFQLSQWTLINAERMRGLMPEGKDSEQTQWVSIQNTPRLHQLKTPYCSVLKKLDTTSKNASILCSTITVCTAVPTRDSLFHLPPSRKPTRERVRRPPGLAKEGKLQTLRIPEMMLEVRQVLKMSME